MKALMIVSATAGQELRREVASGLRPCPEYLRLEQLHGMVLLDWSRLPGARRRSRLTSLRQAAEALRVAPGFDAVLSDGEPVGIPFAMGQRLLRRRKPHVMIGHRLSTPAKRPLLRILGAGRDPGRVVVHSTSQLARASALGLGAPRAKCIPYGVDLDFWRGASLEREPLVAAAGRDHRDYSTLAAACSGLAASVVVTGSSAHSPAADAREPEAWPANFRLVKLDYPALRRLYAAASVVVVPLVETDFQAGVTALLEAMAMGKAVVVSATAGLADVIDPGCCVPVPPGSPAALREAIASLIDDPERRRRLGAAARERAEARYGLDAFCAALAGTLEDAACGS